MTPERIEEIKASCEKVRSSIPVQMGRPFRTIALDELEGLLAALEESQQQRDYWENKEEEARWESAKWREDLIKANNKLVEAQQTIARLIDLLNDSIGCLIISTSFENEHVDRLIKSFRDAVGLGEGVKNE